MSSQTIPIISGVVRNDLDLIDKILSIYSIAKDIKIRKFERTVLKYYIKFGCSRETNQYIMSDEKRSEGSIKTTNVHLREKGLLEKSVNNEHRSNLSAEMEAIRQRIISKRGHTFAVILQK